LAQGLTDLSTSNRAFNFSYHTLFLLLLGNHGCCFED
jgi:hypothetical protein